MKINPESFYIQIGQIVANMPDLNAEGWDSPENRLWLGRAAALVKTAGNSADTAMFSVASNGLGTMLHPQNVNTIASILYRTLGTAELEAPAALRGQFIAAGDELSAFDVVGKVFSSAKSDLLIVDAYADHILITDFVVTVPVGIQVRILGPDLESKKALLRPAVERWQIQHGAERLLQVRIAPAQSLHDRLIFVDGTEAWMVGQSFNGLAKRSQTSIQRVDADIARQKIVAYGDIWNSSNPL